MMNRDRAQPRLFAALRMREAEAISQLWVDYFPRMYGLACSKLGGLSSGGEDAEDAAVAAFWSFCDAIAQGAFPRLTDERELWAVLSTLTARHCSNQLRRGRAQKRDRGRETTVTTAAEIESHAHSPSESLELQEQAELLLAELPESLREIALLKLDGYTNQEVAVELGCVQRTVERKLAAIRGIWIQIREDASNAV